MSKQKTETIEREPFSIDIDSILKSSEARIREKVIAGAVDTYSQQLGWELEAHIKKGVEKFFNEEVLPELQKEMQSVKPQMLLSIKAGLLKTAEALGEALYEKAAENLKGYQGGRAIKELFG